jgi:predicted MFS family arabinose efflux permease
MRELFAGRRGLAAAGLLLGEFTAAMQALVLAAIMPRIAADLHGLELYGFAFGALLVASAVCMAFAGPLADRFGTWRILAVAFTLVGAGLLFSSLARTMSQFILARAIEGAGGGLDYAASLGAIAKLYPERLRPKMFALSSTMWVLPALIGPAAGALVASTLGWRWAFAGFIPLIVAAAAMMIPAMRAIPTPREAARPLDAVRMLLAREGPPLRYAAFVSFALLQAAFFGADAYVSLSLTAVRGLSLAAASVCVTMGALGWSLSSVLQPRLFSRVGGSRVVVLGTTIGIVAVVCLAAVAAGAPAAIAFPAWFAGGMGMGFAYPTLTLLALAGAAPGNEGTISSAALLAGSIGMASGVIACGLPITFARAGGYSLQTAVVASFTIAVVAALPLLPLARRLE